jgi:RHS repeat-associated protein
MDRLLSRTPDASFSEPATTFTYTPTGQRATMTDASGTTSYSYDSLNRLLTKATPVGRLTYTYDVAGNRLSMVSSNVNGASASYTYDEMNRLKTVTAVGKTTTYTYDAVGNLNQVALPNAVLVTPSRDTMNRITSLPVTSTPPASYGYTYGPVGNRLTADTTTFNYDSVYRLTQETNPSGALSYLLDPVGNRQSLTSTLAALPPQSFSYDPNDRIVGATYDANGNTLVSGSRTFQYDSLDRLTSFNAGAVAMQYDGDGNRVAKGTTQYLVDDNGPAGIPQVVEEHVGGAVQKTYVYGLDRVSQTIVGGATSYYGYDAHGDVRLLMDGTGAVTDTYDYDAWGNLIASTGSTPNVYLYQGEQYDMETKLYYLRARYYDPLSGRFLTTDPLAAQGQHPYLYAGADPVDQADPTGETPTTAALFDPDYPMMLPPPPEISVGFPNSCLLGMVGQPDQGGQSAEDVFDKVNQCILDSPSGNPGSPGPGSPGPPGPGSPSGPKTKCCERALRDEVAKFLQSTAPKLLGWDPTMAADLVSAGKAAKKAGVDPRLMAAIPAMESGRGLAFQNNNPFGLGPGFSYPSPSSAIHAEGRTLAIHIYDWKQTNVAMLYAGNGNECTSKGCWPPKTVTRRTAYCYGKTPADQAACQAAGGTVATFLSGMRGDAANDLRPGDQNNLTYPCPR